MRRPGPGGCEQCRPPRGAAERQQFRVLRLERLFGELNLWFELLFSARAPGREIKFACKEVRSSSPGLAPAMLTWFALTPGRARRAADEIPRCASSEVLC